MEQNWDKSSDLEGRWGGMEPVAPLDTSKGITMREAYRKAFDKKYEDYQKKLIWHKKLESHLREFDSIVNDITVSYSKKQEAIKALAINFSQNVWESDLDSDSKEIKELRDSLLKASEKKMAEALQALEGEQKETQTKSEVTSAKRFKSRTTQIRI